MADVVYPYVPVDGNILDPAELNKDLYETANNLPVGKLSIYETSNGGIEVASNFHAAYKVQSHHVRPWQVGKAEGVGLLNTLDFYQDAYGPSDLTWYGIAGAQFTFHQDYDCTLAWMMCQAFLSVWRQRGKVVTQEPLVWETIPIIVRMYLDGVALGHTTRLLPETAYYPSTANGGFDWSREQNLTRNLHLFHPKTLGGDAGTKEDALLKGWHNFGLGIYVARNKATETVKLEGDRSIQVPPEPAPPPAIFDAMHRARVYVRHADVVRLL